MAVSSNVHIGIKNVLEDMALASVPQDGRLPATLLSAMGASLTGTIKWIGGVLGGDGKIYCIPHNATDILIIDVANGTASLSDMGASLTGTSKWSGGVLGGDGKIYCIPYSATDILIIDVANGTASRSSMGATWSGSARWRGGSLGGDGKIYGVPHSATDILIIDVANGTASLSAMGASLSGTFKWSGGVLGGDGKIYCIPGSATDILIIDVANGTASRSAMGASLSGSTKWHTGVLGPDGKIYGIPNSATDILIIDVANGTASRDFSGLSGSLKWQWGVLGGDDRIYGIPYDATDILIIDLGSTPAITNLYNQVKNTPVKWNTSASSTLQITFTSDTDKKASGLIAKGFNIIDSGVGFRLRLYSDANQGGSVVFDSDDIAGADSLLFAIPSSEAFDGSDFGGYYNLTSNLDSVYSLVFDMTTFKSGRIDFTNLDQDVTTIDAIALFAAWTPNFNIEYSSTVSIQNASEFLDLKSGGVYAAADWKRRRLALKFPELSASESNILTHIEDIASTGQEMYVVCLPDEAGYDRWLTSGIFKSDGAADQPLSLISRKKALNLIEN